MLGKLAARRVGFLAIVAVAGVLHLLLLCVPVALLNGGFRNATSPPTVVFFALVCAWQIVEALASAGEVRRPLQPHGPEHLALAIGVCLLLVFWLSLADVASSASTPFGVATSAGSSLMVAGLALRYLALRKLGAFFLNEVAILPDQALVTDGIYRWLRHPAETGTVCLALGGAGVLGSVHGLIACTLLLVPCLVWRTRLEDGLLREHHGTEFIRYRNETPAFFPRLRHGGHREQPADHRSLSTPEPRHHSAGGSRVPAT